MTLVCTIFRITNLPILGLQPRDKAAMLVVNTKETFLLNLHQNRVHFPAERNAFVLDPQHGRRDVTCKPAIFANLQQSVISAQNKCVGVVTRYLRSGIKGVGLGIRRVGSEISLQKWDENIFLITTLNIHVW